MEQPWPLSVAKLSVAGRRAEALHVLQAEMNRGSLAALAAYAWRCAGAEITHEEAARLVERVENELNSDDLEAHLQLAHAYDVGVAT
jgi:hypothetical protein